MRSSTSTILSCACARQRHRPPLPPCRPGSGMPGRGRCGRASSVGFRRSPRPRHRRPGRTTYEYPSAVADSTTAIRRAYGRRPTSLHATQRPIVPRRRLGARTTATPPGRGRQRSRHRRARCTRPDRARRTCCAARKALSHADAIASLPMNGTSMRRSVPTATDTPANVQSTAKNPLQISQWLHVRRRPVSRRADHRGTGRGR